MAYTINSAKDVASDEQVFVDRFNQNLNAILAYKRAHGGDLEGAYQKVTGEAWPAGRSVELDNGRGVMTKDRTVKSVVGKYVLPIAAGALTGGAALGVGPLAGVFGGAASAAGSGAGIVPGTTIAGGAGQVPVWAGGAAAATAAPGAAATLGTTGHLTNAAYNAVPAAITSQGVSQLVNRGAPAAIDMLKNTVPGVADRLSEGVDGEGLSPLLRAAIGALAGIGPAIMASRTPEPSAEEKALMDQARQLQALQQQRIQHQNPLFDAVTRLAMSRLPTAQQRQMGDL